MPENQTSLNDHTGCVSRSYELYRLPSFASNVGCRRPPGGVPEQPGMGRTDTHFQFYDLFMQISHKIPKLRPFSFSAFICCCCHHKPDKRANSPIFVFLLYRVSHLVVDVA